VAHVIQRCILPGFAGTGAGVYLVRFSGMTERQERAEVSFMSLQGDFKSCVTNIYSGLLTNRIV
jgi:hypothetical protein